MIIHVFVCVCVLDAEWAVTVKTVGVRGQSDRLSKQVATIASPLLALVVLGSHCNPL